MSFAKCPIYRFPRKSGPQKWSFELRVNCRSRIYFFHTSWGSGVIKQQGLIGLVCFKKVIWFTGGKGTHIFKHIHSLLFAFFETSVKNDGLFSHEIVLISMALY